MLAIEPEQPSFCTLLPAMPLHLWCTGTSAQRLSCDKNLESAHPNSPVRGGRAQGGEPGDIRSVGQPWARGCAQSHPPKTCAFSGLSQRMQWKGSSVREGPSPRKHRGPDTAPEEHPPSSRARGRREPWGPCWRVDHPRERGRSCYLDVIDGVWIILTCTGVSVQGDVGEGSSSRTQKANRTDRR